MRPATPHSVLSLDDCLTLGGHFFSKENFSRSVQAMLLENVAGQFITNTEHPTSPLVLAKLVGYYHNEVEKGISLSE